MIETHLFLCIGWILYCFLHSYLAIPNIKEVIQQTLKLQESTFRLMYNFFAFATLVVLIYFQYNIFSIRLIANGNMLRVFAYTFIGMGAIIMLVCIAKYFKQLSGIDKTGMSKKLEVTGMHKIVRHPLYFGTFVFLIGLFLYAPLVSNGLAVFIIIVYTLIGIRFEERKLISKFADDYILYQKQVPMILPGFGKRNNGLK